MNPSALTALVLVVLVAGASVWVLRDAQARAERRRPVVAVLFGITIERPQSWAVRCLLGSVLFIPTYLVARGADG